jgi:hypothetical protein
MVKNTRLIREVAENGMIALFNKEGVIIRASEGEDVNSLMTAFSKVESDLSSLGFRDLISVKSEI